MYGDHKVEANLFVIGVCYHQEGDVAFSVPNSLVVTLERVLGNETVGKMLLNLTLKHQFQTL